MAADRRAGSGDPAELVARVSEAKRDVLLRVHRHRLGFEDLEDCFSQATLELVSRARTRARAFVSEAHLVIMGYQEIVWAMYGDAVARFTVNTETGRRSGRALHGRPQCEGELVVAGRLARVRTDQGTGGSTREAIEVTGLEYQAPRNASARINARMCRRFTPGRGGRTANVTAPAAAIRERSGTAV